MSLQGAKTNLSDQAGTVRSSSMGSSSQYYFPLQRLWSCLALLNSRRLARRPLQPLKVEPGMTSYLIRKRSTIETDDKGFMQSPMLYVSVRHASVSHVASPRL